MKYTGVGSRKTPNEILELMTKIAKQLNNESWLLRTGDAKGADSAFANGSTKKEIYKANDANEKARKISQQFHPAWERMTEFAKNLHGRNAFQILGKELNDPVKFLIC